MPNQESTIILGKEKSLIGGRLAILRSAMKSRETLQDYVRRIVAEKGLSHVKVAQRAKRLGGKLSAGYVNSIIQGHVSNPGIETLKQLALGLGEPEEELFEVARGKQLSDDANYKESYFATIYAEFRRLPEADKRELRPMIELIKKEIQRRLKS